jgi:hypothetical protein
LRREKKGRGERRVGWAGWAGGGKNEAAAGLGGAVEGEKGKKKKGVGRAKREKEREKEMHLNLNLKFKFKWKTSNETMQCGMKCTRPIFLYISFYG